MRMPKFGAYHDASVYDFIDEPEEASPTKLEHRRGSNPMMSPPRHRLSDITPEKIDEHSPLDKRRSTDVVKPEEDITEPTGLKLKVSGGKIIRFVLLRVIVIQLLF
jgi:hypothetical protein